MGKLNFSKFSIVFEDLVTDGLTLQDSQLLLSPEKIDLRAGNVNFFPYTL